MLTVTLSKLNDRDVKNFENIKIAEKRSPKCSEMICKFLSKKGFKKFLR